MSALPPHVKDLFYQTLKGDISLEAFEQWLYAESELEGLLSSDDYLALISLHFRQPGAKYNLWNLLRKHIDLGEFESYKLQKLLTDARQKHENLPLILIDFYNLYCKGYYFLERLGLGYGLAVETPYQNNMPAECWDDLPAREKQALLASFSPGLEEEIDRVAGWLESKSIVLTGTPDEYGHYGYDDFRSLAERNS